MKIAIIGTGYVGLVTGACLARAGHQVLCIDKNADKIESLRRAECPFYEPGLDELVRGQTGSGSLKFDTSLEAGVDGAEIVMLAVGTPSKTDGSADLGNLFSCAREVAAALRGDALVVVKSTAPVGTCDRIQHMLDEHRPAGSRNRWLCVASNPEFLAEGTAVDDCMYPERIVIGVRDERSRQMLTRMYRAFDPAGQRLLCMDVRSAEFAKYACNAMLAARISTVNELASIAGSVEADMGQACRVMGLDRRIGKRYLRPGAGYGGSCLPKDVEALIHLAHDHGEPATLLRSVQAVNERQVGLMAKAIERHFDDGLSGRTVAVWGLSFKPGTDDVRASPSLRLIDELIRLGARVQAYDPIAAGHVRGLIPDARLTLAPTAAEACRDADALAVMTEWNEFEHPDFARLARVLKGRAVFDGRRLYEADELHAHGLWHYVPGQKLESSSPPPVHAASIGTAFAQRPVRQEAGPAPLNLNVSSLSQRSRP